GGLGQLAARLLAPALSLDSAFRGRDRRNAERGRARLPADPRRGGDALGVSALGGMDQRRARRVARRLTLGAARGGTGGERGFRVDRAAGDRTGCLRDVASRECERASKLGTGVLATSCELSGGCPFGPNRER